MSLLCLFLTLLSVFPSFCGKDQLRAYSPGDIIIGGLFPLHTKTNRATALGPISCSGLSVQLFSHSQVMMYAIRDLNQRTPRVLPNITIGYDIYDTCGDVSLALAATLKLLNHQNCSLLESKTKAVIGAYYSEVSVPVARMTALSSVAQISFASTSERLSNKMKFPTFLRTIYSDEYQTKGMVELSVKLNWKTVAIVGSDDAYGRYGSERLEQRFRQKDICIDFINILPSTFSQNTSTTRELLEKLVSTINNSPAEAIIIFSKSLNVVLIIEAAIKSRLNRTWIASDSWSTSKEISSMQHIERAGQVFGFIIKRNDVPGFKNYVVANFNNTTNTFLENYWSHFNCSNQSKARENHSSPEGSEQNHDPCSLANHIDRDYSYSTYLAVQVIGEGLRRLLKCDNQRCERTPHFTALELFKEIQKVNLTVNTTHIYFDANGDRSLEYEIVYWYTNELPRQTHIKTIGGYATDGGVQIQEGHESNVDVSVYNCSKSCYPGHQWKEQDKTCCKICVPCEDEEFSPDGEECKSCGNEKYSSPLKDFCVDKKAHHLYWSDPFIIILCCIQTLGIIVTVVLIIVFTIYRKTPVVKAVGGYLCFLELFSLLACFCITFSLEGEATKTSCMVGMPIFGVAFSLCISCIIVNLLKIHLGFSFNLHSGTWIKKLNKPVPVVSILFAIQFAVCVSWIYFAPPTPIKVVVVNIIVHHCGIGSNTFFGVMLSYNAFLALICFLFAFKGKKLPDLYNNASLVAVSMLLYLIIWVLFIPIYISLIGKYKRATESVAMLVSTYSVICFHLAPKCFIMLFRQDMNNERAITEYIRKYYEQRGLAVVTS